MYTEDLTVIAVYAAVGYFLVVTFTALLRKIVFLFEPIFRAINRLQWIIQNPIRFLWKAEGKMSRGSFMTLTMTGIIACWWIVSYFITLPFRLVTGLYYDVILFSAISFADNIDEFIKPRRGKLSYQKGIKYFFCYIITLPFRAVKMIIKSGMYVLDSILMFGISIVFPTLTMLHGTEFKKAGTKIVQDGEWRVGTGNYAGTGVYFGLDSKTAKHYAKRITLADNDISIVLVRVTLTFCKNTATLTDEDRKLIGLGDSGEQLAKRVKGFYSSMEHYRSGYGWWEYCLLAPGKMNLSISSWRVRPVALIRDGIIDRTYGGFSHYSLGGGMFFGILSWIIIAGTILLYQSNF